MGKDPVCHEEVTEMSEWSSTYQDRTYYFNSPECKADFDRDPGRYALAETSEAGTESAYSQAGRSASRARAKIQSMLTERKSKAAEQIGSVSNAFRSASQRLAEQNQHAVAGYVERAADNVDRISRYLQQHNAEEIISEAEDFVRRRPGWMIGGAFAAGFVMARFLKSSRSVSA